MTEGLSSPEDDPLRRFRETKPLGHVLTMRVLGSSIIPGFIEIRVDVFRLSICIRRGVQNVPSHSQVPASLRPIYDHLELRKRQGGQYRDIKFEIYITSVSETSQVINIDIEFEDTVVYSRTPNGCDKLSGHISQCTQGRQQEGYF